MKRFVTLCAAVGAGFMMTSFALATEPQFASPEASPSTGPVYMRGTMAAYFADDMVCYVRPGDVDDLTRAMTQLATDPALRQRLGERGRALVSEQFPVQRMVDQLAALYRRLTSPSHEATSAP